MYRILVIALAALVCPFIGNGVLNGSVSERNAVVVPVNLDFHKLQQIIEGMLKEVRAGNIEKAYNDYTTETFRKNTTLTQFKKFIEEYKVLSNNKVFQYQSFYVENGVATFGGDFVSNNGEQVTAEVDLVQENGSWKINGIDLIESEPALPPRNSGSDVTNTK